MRAVLMIAYHYPPCFGSSGVHRTAKFSRYLPEHGWRPLVLTAHPRAYPERREARLDDIPPQVQVCRAFALDAGRHLAIRGRTARALALPDRWWSWWLGAVPAGLALVRRHRPRAIWSTFPVATAHMIGLTLARLTRLPWVADFRDPMTEDDYPRRPGVRRAYRAIERGVVRRAQRLVFTAESARRMYLARYPGLAPERCLVIPNGYDEEDFADLAAGPPPGPSGPGPLRLVHSGLVYPEERDPRPFFRALSRLKRAGRISAATLQVDLRAAGSESYYAGLLAELEVGDIVRLLPALPYRESLRACAEADALLLLQGPSCNGQIPAKAYEYLRLGRPILALTDRAGDTARLLLGAGGATLLDIQDEAAIEQGLPAFLAAVVSGAHARTAPAIAARYARRAQTADLASCLSAVAPESRGA
jgi:glycosyltransferase involved in cell wall biosynthesis